MQVVRMRDTFSRFSGIVVVYGVYTFLTLFLIAFFEPGLTPPGYTGRAMLALPFFYAGSLHIALHTRCGSLFYVLGGVVGFAESAAYLGDSRLGLALAYGDPTVADASLQVVALILLSVLPPRLLASCAWWMLRKRADKETHGFPVVMDDPAPSSVRR
jgi:hypothetical protein